MKSCFDSVSIFNKSEHIENNYTLEYNNVLQLYRDSNGSWDRW